MNTPPPIQPGIPPKVLSDELKKYLLRKQGKGPLFAFLLSSSTIFLVFLISVLKPNRFYKKFLDFLFGINIKIKGYKYSLHHFLLLVAGFYGSLYFFLLMQGRQNYPSKMDTYTMKMEKLDRKWVNESQCWLAFLIVICLLSVYKNTKLFNVEGNLDKQLEKYLKSEEKKTKKNE